MADERKATDILLSIEQQVALLNGKVNLYEHNGKLVLDRLNKLLIYVEGAQKEEAQVAQEAIDNAPVPSIPPEQVVEIAKEPLSPRRGGRQEVVQTQQSSSSDKKIPVIQRITDHMGKDIFMADITITDSTTETIAHKTKTNALGKWQALLKPGHYKVDMVKVDAATKAKVEAHQDITVSESNTTITLPVAIIKR